MDQSGERGLYIQDINPYASSLNTHNTLYYRMNQIFNTILVVSSAFLLSCTQAAFPGMGQMGDPSMMQGGMGGGMGPMGGSMMQGGGGMGDPSMMQGGMGGGMGGSMGDPSMGAMGGGMPGGQPNQKGMNMFEVGGVGNVASEDTGM